MIKAVQIPAAKKKETCNTPGSKMDCFLTHESISTKIESMKTKHKIVF